MISSALNLVPRLALSSFLTASCFGHVVIRPTLQVISEAETVTVGLVTVSICHSTIFLVLAADTVAKKIIDSYKTTKKIAAAEDPIAEHKHTLKATQCSTLTAHIQPTNSESHCIFQDSDSPTRNISRYSLSSDTTLVADDDDIPNKVMIKERAADEGFASLRRSQLRPLHLVTKLRATSDPIDVLTQKMEGVSLVRSTFGIRYVARNQTTPCTATGTLAFATPEPARKTTPRLRRKARVGSLRQAYIDHERVSQ